jgi:glucokinase
LETRGLAIGIDLGGTKTAAGLVDLATRELLARQQVATSPERGGEAVLDDVLKLAAQLAGDPRCGGRRPLGVGVGIAELVDRGGRPASGATIDWRGFDLERRFHSATGLPLRLDADVRAAARGESCWGAGHGADSFLYVTIGTGISASLVAAGEPLAGSRGLAGVCASGRQSIPTPEGNLVEGPPLESFASGPAIASRYARLAGEDVATALVLGRADARDPLATEVVESAARAIGAAIGGMVSLLDPQRVVVGGGLGLADGLFRATIDASFRDHVWSPLHRDVPLVSATLGVDAGVCGAALLLGSVRSQT